MLGLTHRAIVGANYGLLLNDIRSLSIAEGTAGPTFLAAGGPERRRCQPDPEQRWPSRRAR